MSDVRTSGVPAWAEPTDAAVQIRAAWRQQAARRHGIREGEDEVPLTTGDIQAIRFLLERTNRPMAGIADLFGVSRSTVSRIYRGIAHTELQEAA